MDGAVECVSLVVRFLLWRGGTDMDESARRIERQLEGVEGIAGEDGLLSRRALTYSDASSTSSRPYI